MKTSDCFSPGFIIKAHGLKGAVTAKITLKNPGVLQGLDIFFLEVRGQLVPFPVESISLKESTAYIKFEGVDTTEQSEALKSAKLYLPISLMPPVSDDDSSLLVGYTVMDEIKGNLGKVKEIMQAGPQETLIVEHPETDILIPFVPQIVIKTDHPARILHTRCPEGLVDLYLIE